MTVSHREKNIFMMLGFISIMSGSYHLLEFDNEKQILSEAYSIYRKLKREGNW